MSEDNTGNAEHNELSAESLAAAAQEDVQQAVAEASNEAAAGADSTDAADSASTGEGAGAGEAGGVDGEEQSPWRRTRPVCASSCVR